ncbi:hypothetical protein DFP73DRAFT_587993 [Morchella snyderi]|nr:hypothetical protein DFP73DRAFT_587993 [Morchella snyderi]
MRPSKRLLPHHPPDPPHNPLHHLLPRPRATFPSFIGAPWARAKKSNYQINLLKRLLDFIAGRFPDYHRRTLHKEGICEIPRKIEFPPDFCVIVDNAKYNEEHVGFLLWKAYLVAEARHITNNRRKAQYAREKRKKNGAVILLENMAFHKESIDLLRKEVSETQERRELFGKKLEMILEALANFKNDFDTTATLRSQGGEKANEMTESLLQDQEEHSEMIARLKDALEMLGGLGNDIERFKRLKSDQEIPDDLEGNMKKLVQEHILKESTA